MFEPPGITICLILSLNQEVVMRKLSVLVAWATLVALATVAPQVASPAYATAPLIPNTGFEDGTTGGWTSSSGSLVAFNPSIEDEGQGGWNSK